MTTERTPLPLILASRSPRRRELLERIGLRPVCLPSGADETPLVGESPASHVERLAREKCARVAAGHRDAVVIAADTVVVLDERILVQPRGEADAMAMLAALSGRVHEVFTGCTVARGGRTATGVEIVRVEFRPLSDAEILQYVATGEPLDKAGAYGIQGAGAMLVRRIEGDYTAVVGLPLPLLLSHFDALGLRLGPDGLTDA